MKKSLQIFIVLLLIKVPLSSRDIDLDGIYLSKTSHIYNRICDAKENLYRKISSEKVDNKVIFAQWLNGSSIIYIKEIGNLNLICIWNVKKKTRQIITRLKGTVSSSMLNENGKILALKMLYTSQSYYPRAMNIYMNTENHKITTEDSLNMFQDASFMPGGDLIIKDSGDKLSSYNPFNRNEKIVVTKKEYKKISKRNSPVLAYFSPNRDKKILISGSGGSYEALLIYGKKEINLKQITSSSDIAWIDNSKFIYRSGSQGNYSVNIYDVTIKKSVQLIEGTMNPDINISIHPEIITFLNTQIINIYYPRTGKQIHTGLEGEEAYFSPDGSKFTSLYLGDLYLTQLNSLLRKNTEIRRTAALLEKLYKDAKSDSTIWLNNYSKRYIERKIFQYKKIISP